LSGTYGNISPEMAKDMPARMLRLLSLLQSRREWSGVELADRLGVTDRTVRRDLDRLRNLGYPVEGTTGTAGGYRLASGSNIPPLLLDDEEAVAIVVGLRAAVSSGVSGTEEITVRALAKLQQLLPTRLRQQIAAVDNATSTLSFGGSPQTDLALLAILALACRDHEVLRFEYRRRDGAAVSRRVEPHSLVTGHGRWWLIAYDLERDGWRTYRVDRLTQPMPVRLRFTPRTLPAKDPSAYVARAITTAPYRYAVRVTVRAPAEAVLARTYASLPGEVEPVDAHTCVVRLRADSLDLITQHLAAWGADFILEGPQEVLDHLHVVGRRLMEVGGGPRDLASPGSA
jgi:predicted DNA-binding transcriptional regulator YafY